MNTERFDPVTPLRVDFDDDASRTLRPRRVTVPWGTQWEADLGGGWVALLVRLGRGHWVAMAQLAVPWRPQWRWTAAPHIIATSRADAIVQLRRLLAGPGLDLDGVYENALIEAGNALDGASDDDVPRVIRLRERMRQLEQAIAVEKLPPGPVRDTAIRLACDGVPGSGAQLVDAAMAIAT